MQLLRNRAVGETWHGHQHESDLRKALIRRLPRPSNSTIREAVQAHERGNTQGALSLLADAALEDAENLRVPTTMAKLLIRYSRHAQTQQLLSALPDTQREEPDVRDVLVHLGFLWTAQDTPDEKLLEEKVANDPHDLVAHHQLCAPILVQDDFERAMKLLLDSMRVDRRYGDGMVRKGLLSLFNMPGVDQALIAR